MYAIAFDLDTECLKKKYPGANYTNAYGEIKGFLAAKGFSNKQGSLYYGGKNVTMVSAVMVVAEMSQEFAWLETCVSDIRILQIMDSDDLLPAVKMGAALGKKKPKAKVALKELGAAG